MSPQNNTIKQYMYPVFLFGPRSLSSNKFYIRNQRNTNNLTVYRNNLQVRESISNNAASSSRIRSRSERQADLTGAASGYGEYYCPEGVPVETALFAILAAFGVAFGAIWRAITLQTGGRRRKRSSKEPNSENDTSTSSALENFSDLLWSGRLEQYVIILSQNKSFILR